MQKITLYTTGCPRCRVLQQKLDGAGVEYEMKTDLNEMLDLGIEFAPALEVDGVLMDFSHAVAWVGGQ